MLSFDECKKIAEEKASAFGTTINKAYTIRDGFVFDNSDEEIIGILPVVVNKKTGEIMGLWHYINKNNLSMDDMQEIEVEKYGNGKTTDTD